MQQAIDTNATKIQWRMQEVIFVTTIALIFLAGRLWYIFHHQHQLEEPFYETHTVYSIYKNVIIPEFIVGMAIYLVYLFFSIYTVPRLLRSIPRHRGKYLNIAGQIVVAIALPGIVFNFAEYYLHQWQFNYQGFSIFFNRDNPRSQMNLAGNFYTAAGLILMYGLYIAGRETIIYFIEKSKQAAFNICICNKVTIFAFTLISVYILLLSFDLAQERQTLSKYLLIISGIFATFVSNVYWLFPLTNHRSFFSSRILIRLLITSLIYSAPLITIVNENGPAAMLYSWALQLFIITPITWIYYQFNKERILRLRVAETALTKSKADLQFLRSQVNPHFLFNTLNTLYGTALQENAERTAEGIQMLGDMMRFMLHENHLPFIDMQKEIGYLQNYIALQKLRVQTGSNVIIADNIEGRPCHHSIAPMLLIPLVENAFKHGISLKEKSWISIVLDCSERNIQFQVVNSLHTQTSSDPEKEKSGIGLTNVAERLKIIYPGRHDLSITHDEKQFSVKLSIML